MTALTTSDLTVSVIKRRKRDRGTDNLCTISFGNGAKTFPTGGIAVTPGMFGLYKQIESMEVSSQATGFLMTFDRTNQKIGFLGASLTPISSAATACVLEVEVKGK